MDKDNEITWNYITNVVWRLRFRPQAEIQTCSMNHTLWLRIHIEPYKRKIFNCGGFPFKSEQIFLYAENWELRITSRSFFVFSSCFYVSTIFSTSKTFVSCIGIQFNISKVLLQLFNRTDHNSTLSSWIKQSKWLLKLQTKQNGEKEMRRYHGSSCSLVKKEDKCTNVDK